MPRPLRPLARLALATLAAVSLAAVTAPPALAQYFGRNKVQYENFKFRSFETDHFRIYYYAESELAVRDAARMAERWYERHRRTFINTFGDRKALVFYANDADFQQTNVIQGQIGEGTGGVTEGLKQRVTMPLTGSYAETDHVLGHELVHSFQYDLALSKDTSGFNLGAFPLWVIEGTAEYLSLGRQDPHTAMWLRDAALRDDIPTANQLTRDTRYFPYRYGQALMAYVGGKYGDAALANLYRIGGRAGLDSAFVYALGISSDSLSREWAQTIKDTYLPLARGRVAADSAGRLVLSEKRGSGKLNVAPAVSPDGRYIAYLSERDLFNINLFVADAETGRVVKKLTETNANAHFDAIRFISSSGSWSPEGNRLAFVTFVEGDNEISVFDVGRQRVVDRYRVGGVGSIANPAWSPDGRSIAFSGINGGVSDLYVLDIATKNVRQLTDDRFADLQPTWSPDGRRLAFTTDRGPEGTDFEALTYAEMRLGIIDVATAAIDVLRPFGASMHHNPQFSRDGASVYYISDQDGFRDVYRTEIASGTTYRVTNLQTGVSGITSLSPAMTVARGTGRMAFSVFSDNNYRVFTLEEPATQGTPITPRAGGIATASVLPPFQSLNTGLVAGYLRDPAADLPVAQTDPSSPYRARLKLDFIAPPTVGVGVGGYNGSQVQGGVGFFFSDLLGNHNLTVVAQANGTFKDLGGQVQYLNLKNRLNYGGVVSHTAIPYGFQNYEVDPNTGQITAVLFERRRIYISQAAALSLYPLSTTRRFEGDLGVTRYGFGYEQDRYPVDGGFIGRPERRNIEAPSAIFAGRAGTAYVTDFSNFGFTSPVQGGRSRYQISGTYLSDGNDAGGAYGFATALADYRRYFFYKPVTFAVRGLHIGNYGVKEDNQTRIGQEYLNSSYYPGFVRGYGYRSLDINECPTTGTGECPVLDRLQGSRIALASAEVRFPLFGTRDFGLFNFPYLPTELALFADAGLSWTGRDRVIGIDPLNGEEVRVGEKVRPFAFVTGAEARNTTDRIPVTSIGASTRVNVLGYAVLEIFYAYPFQRPDKGAHFGFALSPGW